MQITVPQSEIDNGHFWKEPAPGMEEFWAFRWPVRAKVGDKIIFNLDRKPIAEAVISRIEKPGESQCAETERFLNRWKVYWTPESFKKVEPKTAAADTSAFDRWFAGSKVVDAQGNPLVVYHGTMKSFDEFKHGDIGFHVGNKDQAERRLRSREKKREQGSPTLMSLYASIKNPLKTQDAGDWSNPYSCWDAVNKALKGQIADLMPKMIDTSLPREERLGLVRQACKDRGYDGIVYKNLNEGTGLSWIAFEPTQLKAYNTNNGDFDPEKASITAAGPVNISPSSKFKEKILVIVHPGSACGSADFNYGSRSIAQAERKGLINEWNGWQEGVIVIDGELSDELKDYPELDAALEGVLARAKSKGLVSERREGDDPAQVKVIRQIVKEKGWKPGDYYFVCTGAWAYNDGDGCVTSVCDVLRRMKFSAEISDAALTGDDKLAKEGSTTTVSAQQLGRAVKHWSRSEESYELLDATPANGGTWTSGGCLILADALQKTFGGEVYAIMGWPNISAKDKTPTMQHAVLKLNGGYVDADGYSTEAQLARRWRDQEHVIIHSIVPVTSEIAEVAIKCGTPGPAKAEEIGAAIKKTLTNSRTASAEPSMHKHAFVSRFNPAELKTLKEMESRSGDFDFLDWLKELIGDDTNPSYEEVLADEPLRLDYFNDWLQEDSIGVEEHGYVTFWKLTPDVEELVGDLPVVVYHHTSSSILPKIKREGLRADVKRINTYQNSGAGVYVTTELSGPAVQGYRNHAVQKHRRGGHPVTLEIKTYLSELEPDPDDADIQSGAHQFILPYVDPKDIIFPATKNASVDPTIDQIGDMEIEILDSNGRPIGKKRIRDAGQMELANTFHQLRRKRKPEIRHLVGLLGQWGDHLQAQARQEREDYESKWIDRLENVVYTNETSDGTFAIVVNNLDDATYAQVLRDGKKIGEITTAPHRIDGTVYTGISSVDVEPKYRERGLAKEMYKALLKHLGTAGIASHLPNRANHRQIPSIYRSLGGYTEGDWAFIPKRSKLLSAKS